MPREWEITFRFPVSKVQLCGSGRWWADPEPVDFAYLLVIRDKPTYIYNYLIALQTYVFMSEI